MEYKKNYVSIVMPFFNHPDLVCQMIDSIIANTYTQWELIAVDDGSNEQTKQKLQQYSTKDNRIKILNRTIEPKGAPTCRNIGIENASGEYIIFFDSDDYINEHCLAERVKAISKKLELDFMIFPSGVYNGEEIIEDDYQNSYGYPIYPDDIQAFAERNLPYIVWNNIYRTQSLKSNNIKWDEELLSLQDSDFNLQCLLKGLKYEYANTKPHYGYRIENKGKSISTSLASKEKIESQIYHVNKFNTYIQDKFGHCYDKALHSGVLFMYNMILRNGFDSTIAHELETSEREHNISYCKLFHLQIVFSKFLVLFLNKRRARQIPMFFYLQHQEKIRREKEKLIKEIISNRT